MAKNIESAQKEWIKNLWINCNKQQGAKNESLWSRVSEMVYAFNGERQSQGNQRIMKPDSVPVGVDCTLSPVLPTSVNGDMSSSDYCVSTATSAATTPVSNSSILITQADSPVKRVVCSPDLPVYPLASAARTEVKVEPTTTKAEPVADSQPKVYRCTICSEGFNQKVSLTAHLKTHTKESDDPYQCNFCGKKFAVPARLTRHYRTHTGEKPYQCEYCNKSFSVKENLSVHKRIHTKERPYKCDVCDRAFEHSGKLHRHMRIHTGERPHKCNFCAKTFIQSGQLVIHLRTHTGEKPYVCKCCNKGFTCSKQLKVHTRTHTGEKPYACDICGKSFGYNHVLKLHQVAHYGEKVYKCTICQETFNSKKSMETHIKMAHSDSNVTRNGLDSESPSTSSASDKENKMDVPVQMKYPSSASATVTSASEHSQSTASTLSTLRPISEARLLASSPSSMYESYLQAATTNGHNAPTTSNGTTAAYEAPYYSPPLPTRHNQGGLNSALLAVAAAATEELVMNYQSVENGSLAAHPSKFQIPAASSGLRYYSAPSPSSYSDSSRSSPSPKLEIVEQPEDVAPLYILPDQLRYRHHSALAGTSTSSSVIIQVPYADGGLTPSSSSSASPIPSPTSLADLSSKDELSLPPRKRTKMILKSMEKEKMEDTNFRYNSVIHYAKASQIA